MKKSCLKFPCHIFGEPRADYDNWGKKILVIHSGGLQGVPPMNQRLQKKGLPILNYFLTDIKACPLVFRNPESTYFHFFQENVHYY